MGNFRANEKAGNDFKLSGSIYEHKFVVDAMLRGLYPHQPPADMPCHDFIVLNSKGGSVITQVKSSVSPQARSSSEKDGSVRYKVQTMCHAKQTILADTFVNVISAYVIPYDTWYHIPAKEIRAKGINLHPHIIGSKGMWEKYKGAWEVFDRKF